jgi:hypothetical protein
MRQDSYKLSMLILLSRGKLLVLAWVKYWLKNTQNLVLSLISRVKSLKQISFLVTFEQLFYSGIDCFCHLRGYQFPITMFDL